MLTIEWRPHHKQEIALQSTAFETFYGGARAGGKTDAGMCWLLYDIEHPQFRALVIRKNYDDLKDWLDRAEHMYRSYRADFTGKPAEITFPSGAKIRLGHLKDDKAFSKYQGHEYQRMLLEEVQLIPTEELYMKLLASCRSTIPALPARSFLTGNPGGIGHGWVKKRFIDPSIPMRTFSDAVSGRTRIYIPATVEDNPTIMTKDPDYVKYLDSLPPDLKAQWRDGSWDNVKVKGAYYADELAAAQVAGRIGELVKLDFDPVYTAWDLGLDDLQVCWFFQIKGDQVRIFDLYFDNEKGFEFYVQMLREKKYNFAKHFLPHDGSKRSNDSLRSFKDVLGAEFGEDCIEIIPRTKDKLRDIQHSRSVFSRCWFDAIKCARGLEALTNYRKNWVEEKGAYEEKPYHDWTSHFADGFQGLTLSLPKPKVFDNRAYQKQAQQFINEGRETTVDFGNRVAIRSTFSDSQEGF